MFRHTTLLGSLILAGFLIPTRLRAQDKMMELGPGKMNEPLRPQYHFTPERNWNNDPNGLVFYKGEYHLFYQYYPKAMEWGPMHWGHAVSPDMLHWENLPIALAPDSIGYIFSGSAVVDQDNTSGFGRGADKALVAIFTYHNPKTNVESQAIAYSTDQGRTWTKYKGNPVIPNPGLRDFRDPKVRWFPPLKKWMMVVSCHDHVAFYSSPDLKHWTKESDFGKDMGSHAGVWECPDLFPLAVNGGSRTRWILTVNSGGGPSKTRGTQYFIGDFDGHGFSPVDQKTRWLEDGADQYAGVTWSNIKDRTIYMGWLDNWPGKNKDKPEYVWRGGMTLPVELRLVKTGDGEEFVAKAPIREIKSIEKPVFSRTHLKLTGGSWSRSFPAHELSSSRISLTRVVTASPLRISLGNEAGQHLDILYDPKGHQLIIDRAHADGDDFHAESPRSHAVDLPSEMNGTDLTILYDRSVVEVFFDHGRYLTMDLVFPSLPYSQLKIEATGELSHLEIAALKSVWR